MSVTKVTKSQLTSITTDFATDVNSYSSTFSDMVGTLNSIPNHSEFSSLSSRANKIANSLEDIYVDLKNVSSNLKTYVECVEAIDNDEVIQVEESKSSSYGPSVSTSKYTGSSNSETWTNTVTTASVSASTTNAVVTTLSNNSSGNYTYSYSASPSGTIVYTNNFSSNLLTNEDYNVVVGGKYNYAGIEKSLESMAGVSISVPAGLGSVHTYMGWQCITAKGSTQYKLREAAGMNFDDEGFAKIGDRYVIACTTTFGNVGDYIDVYKEDGTIIKCVIGDIKSQGDAGCTQWGHSNGQNVIEFIVDKNTWYGGHANPGTASCHPELNQNITKVVNKGNFFEHIKTDAAQFDGDVSELLDKSEAVMV